MRHKETETDIQQESDRETENQQLSGSRAAGLLWFNQDLGVFKLFNDSFRLSVRRIVASAITKTTANVQGASLHQGQDERFALTSKCKPQKSPLWWVCYPPFPGEETEAQEI